MKSEDIIINQFKQLNRDAVDNICTHLEQIGELTATDIHRLDQLQRIGTDIKDIENQVQTALNLSQEELHKVFWETAEQNYASYRQTYEQLGITQIPIDENKELKAIVDNVSKVTYNEFVNISQTTGFASIFVKDKKGHIRVYPMTQAQWQPLQVAYQNAIDYAILQVKTGQKDYYTAMRGAVKSFSDVGLSYGVERRTEVVDGKTIHKEIVVEYSSHYKRRLDSSIANAIKGGQQRLFEEQMNAIGKEIGANGYEITAHSQCRESHLWLQGKQFKLKEYNDKVAPELMEPNCGHRAFPIILGISPPTHSKSELANIKKAETTKHEYKSSKYPKRNGQKYTPYEASQIQRSMETAIRQQKDRALAFKAIGDEENEKAARGLAKAKTAEYKEFSAVMGLNTYPKRVTVMGYK